jgi:hypothetical protein
LPKPNKLVLECNYFESDQTGNKVCRGITRILLVMVTGTFIPYILYVHTCIYLETTILGIIYDWSHIVLTVILLVCWCHNV